jgi:hypothetical protein
MRILYRGPLASCNYDCPYCPFAKRRDSTEQLRADRAALERFVDWVIRNPERHESLSVLFTPWGEGLTRSWYRTAIVNLSQLSHVERVAIQTNLAGRLTWLSAANPSRVALWATYHPGQVTQERFLRQCAELERLGIRYSVGVVGLPEHLDPARRLRMALPDGVYLWVNAAEGRSYDAPSEAAWTELDPHFGYSVRPHVSLGHECWAGESVVSVNGDGIVRRCHFIPTPIGNLYDGSYLGQLRPRLCTNAICDCHIGYVHLKRLGLHELFEGGLLERIPTWGAPTTLLTSGSPASTPPR